MGVVAKLMCQFVWATRLKIHNQTFMDISVRLLFLGAVDVPQWVKVPASTDHPKVSKEAKCCLDRGDSKPQEGTAPSLSHRGDSAQTVDSTSS